MPLAKKISALRKRLVEAPLLKGRFVRNVLTITTGTAISQAITLAALPFLSRLYPPSAFGLLAIFMVLSNAASQFSCLGYQGSIVLPKRDESAFTLWFACMVMGAIIGLLTLPAFIIWKVEIANLFGNPELAEWLWLVPVMMFLWAGFEATASWSTRHKNFGQISSGVVSNRLSTAVGRLGLGVTPAAGNIAGTAASSGIVIGHVFGAGVGLVVIMRNAIKDMPARYWKRLRISRIKMLLYRYRHFPGYGLFSSFTAALARSLPVLCLGYFFTPAIVGFFAMSNRLVTAPFQLITNSVVKVFFERATRANRSGDLAEVTVGLYQKLVMLLMTPLALLSIAAPELVTVLLGEDWERTGYFLRWLCVWLFFVSSISPLDRLFLILERQAELALINGGLFVVSFMTLLAGGLTGNAYYTIVLFCIGSSLVRYIQAGRIMAICNAKVSNIFTIPLKETLVMLPFALTLMAIRFQTEENIYIVSAVFVALIGIFGLFRIRAVVSSVKKSSQDK